MAPKQLSVIFILTRQGKIALQNRHGRRMERSMGQQLKMIPLCDQQPFLLQLGSSTDMAVRSTQRKSANC
mgnify:CR=1 FL=1